MTCGMEATRITNVSAVDLVDIAGVPVPIGGNAWVEPHDDNVVAFMARGAIRLADPEPRHLPLDLIAGPPVSGTDAIAAHHRAERRGG